MDRRSVLAGLLAAAVTTALPALAQEPLSLAAFDGWEKWPIVAPGDVALDAAHLVPLRLELDGLFPGPQGFGKGPLDPLTMYMDLIEVSFHGKPALWVQWTSRPPAESPAPCALDTLLVDRASFRLLFRIGSSARGAWAGRYELVQAQPQRIVQVTVEEDGASAKHVLEGAANAFDFATYPFLFALLDLRPGLSLRLSGYDYLEKQPEVLAARVIGRATLTDARGTAHEVWRVDVMPPHRATLISFFVAKEPPFFFGWDYRLTRDGTTALKLTYRGWVATAIR